MNTGIFSIGVDASNIREGGGVTHLREILAVAEPARFGIGRVYLWGGQSLAAQLCSRAWLTVFTPPELDRGLSGRLHWQSRKLQTELEMRSCSLLFVPGGSYSGRFEPFVTMCRNMLPFEAREAARYGFSFRRVRLQLLRRAQTLTFRRAAGLIFLSNYARGSVLEKIGPFPGRVSTIPHGVNPNFSVPEREFRQIGTCSSGDPFRLLFVSHASPYKHQWNVVSAVASLRKRMGWPLRLDLVGPPSVPRCVTKIEDSVRANDPAGEWAIYHGAKSTAEVQEMMRDADLGVFASSCENMPNILLEKMASGLPLVCSRSGPMPEVLGDEGIYFNPESVEEIEDALRSVIADRALRIQGSKSSTSRVAEFGWERCANETFAFLRDVSDDFKKGSSSL